MRKIKKKNIENKLKKNKNKLKNSWKSLEKVEEEKSWQKVRGKQV